MYKTITRIFLLSVAAVTTACAAQPADMGASDPLQTDGAVPAFVEMIGIDGEPIVLAVMPDSTWSLDGPGYVRLEALGRQFTLSRTFEGDGIYLDVEGNGQHLASAEFGPDYLSRDADDDQRRLLSPDGQVASADPLALVDPMAIVLLRQDNWRRLDVLLAGAEDVSASSQELFMSRTPSFGSVTLLAGTCSTVVVAACSTACAGACIGACFWNPRGSACNECVDYCMDHCTSEC